MCIPKTNISHLKQSGFTIVELLIVIVVIAILATISVVAYTGIQERAKLSLMSKDLRGAADAFELYKFDNGSYPTDMPAEIKPSKGVVLSATLTSDGSYCINAYHSSDSSLQASWNSKIKGQQASWCDGPTIGATAGGSVPIATRGANTMPGFSKWTLSSGATYNASTGEMLLGTTGTAKSPLVRVDSPKGMKTGGDMYAAVASANSSLAPQGGYHVSIYYYGSDGVTPVQNTAGYTSNGCAKGIALNAWQTNVQTCAFTGGPGIVYVSYTFRASNGGYASSDLKIKNPLLILND